MKRRICVVAWILALLVLTACGHNEQPMESTTAATTEETAPSVLEQALQHVEKGNLVIMKRTTANGWQELTYTYDEHGNNTATKSVNSKGVTIEYTCKYQIFYQPEQA